MLLRKFMRCISGKEIESRFYEMLRLFCVVVITQTSLVCIYVSVNEFLKLRNKKSNILR